MSKSKKGFFEKIFGGEANNAFGKKVKGVPKKAPSKKKSVKSSKKKVSKSKKSVKNSKHPKKKADKVLIDSKISKKEKENLKKVSNKLRKEVNQKTKEKRNMDKKASKENSEKKSKNKKDEILLTGIKGFDALFEKGNGLPVGASMLIEGGPGSGKTLFCLSTLANLCKKGKKALYMSFEEPEERLIEHMEGFGWPAKKWVKQGLLNVRRFDALDVSRSIEALLSAAKKELLIDVDPVFFPTDFDPNFVVIDSLTSIASAFSGQESRFRIYMEQLFRYLEKNKITNFLIREVSSPSHIGTTFKEQGEAVSFLSDGIIVIYNVIYDSGKRGSAIEILKMRGTNFKKRIVELKVSPKGGVSIFPNRILKKSSKTNFNLT
ncbi:MAG: hypothetical protein KC516_03640 [Nanoarchaeota archaeon]|nr:hypothetical protein [Nanoarchaeota archaeon]